MCMLPGVKSVSLKKPDIVTYAYLGFDLTIKVASDLDGNFNEICELNKTQSVLALPDNVFRSVENQGTEPIIYLEHRLGPYLSEDVIWL